MLQTVVKFKALVFAGFALSAVPVMAMDGDVAEGEKLFKRCATCHMVGDDAKHRVGPILNGVLGRTAGTAEGFDKYGDSLVAAGAAGLVWTSEEMFGYLEDPRKYLRAKLDDKKAKSKMAFKLKGEEDRQNIIAFLKTHSPDYSEEAEAEGESSEAEESTTTN